LPSVTRIQIVGPDSIAPGGSAQFSVVQIFSNGSSVSASSATWSSSQPALLQVNAAGLVTAQAPLRGEATLQAEVPGTAAPGSRRASREILVLPEGTFRLVGTVTEAEAVRVPVDGARVEAAADADSSTPPAAFATTGPDGRYKLYGVPPDAHLRVRKDGYVSTAERMQLAGHDTRNFLLQLEHPRFALAGDYTMTVEVFETRCGLPADLRRRAYDAVVEQEGPHLTVRLTGPRFLVAGGQGDRFSGIVTPTGATFDLENFADWYYYPDNPVHPDVVELLPDATLLVVAGLPSLVATPAGLSGQAGYLGLSQYSGSRFPNVVYMTSCAARLTLTRR
jgi:hypothetical protein